MIRSAPWLSAAALAAGLASAALAQPAPSPAASTAADIDPEAMEAMKRMSAYLAAHTSFELKTTGAFDLVLDDGQRLQFGDNATFKVRRPDRFVIERVGDYKDRRFTYDGKQLTVSSPRTSYYAQVDAPVPRKIVITDRTDPSSPQYTATLSWNFRPVFDAQTFAFKAPAGALPIRLTALTQ